MGKRLLLAGTLLLAAAVTLSCSSKSDSPAGPEGPVYMLRTSPDSVIANIETAYGEMDVEEYLDGLSLDFIFYTSEDDQAGADPLAPEWYKSDERTMHESMFDEGSVVESISLTLTEMDVQFYEGNPADPDDDIWVYFMAVDLRVYETGGLLRRASTPSEFRFRRDTDQVGPQGQALWEIYVWYDLGRYNGLREGSSWGSIKALYQYMGHGK